MKQNLEVGSVIHVKHNDSTISAKIRKIGRAETATGNKWRMATLDLLIPGGEVGYCVVREEELLIES